METEERRWCKRLVRQEQNGTPEPSRAQRDVELHRSIGRQTSSVRVLEAALSVPLLLCSLIASTALVGRRTDLHDLPRFIQSVSFIALRRARCSSLALRGPLAEPLTNRRCDWLPEATMWAIRAHFLP
ncbi:hypothetical protein NDU88_003051 [Pleurodeles waltl]|uniref:Uncharacterized protein n=1 Tax=Pleurodeles waltl TaxID=8319 RepID=A0AAV7W4Y5_PLEWA|nr:hypothetical protein NDU88_003051 [Pleurodeles waltl]